MIRDHFVVQILLCKIIEIMLPETRIDDIRCDHGIKMDAVEFDAVSIQNLSIILDILAHF